MFTVKSTELGKAFKDAHGSLWSAYGRTYIHLSEQPALFHEKFNIKISGSEFDETGNMIWNVTFQNKSAYVLFMLEWS